MLPITNHREFHIPHSIATAAAILGLIAALGWDVSGIDADPVESASGTLEQVNSITAQESEPADETPAPGRAVAGDCDPGVLSGLLPLVLPSISGF